MTCVCNDKSDISFIRNLEGNQNSITVISTSHALAEVKAILSVTPVTLQSQNLDLPELQGTIEEISRSKCSTAADMVSSFDVISNMQTAGEI